jgi:hypothetical protein
MIFTNNMAKIHLGPRSHDDDDDGDYSLWTQPDELKPEHTALKNAKWFKSCSLAIWQLGNCQASVPNISIR